MDFDAEFFCPVMIPARSFGPFPSGEEKDFLDKTRSEEREMELFPHDTPPAACEVTVEKRHPQFPPRIGQPVASS